MLLLLQQKDEVYLNLVLDYVPETVYRVARHYSRAKQTLPMVYVKVYKCVCVCVFLSRQMHTYSSVQEMWDEYSQKVARNNKHVACFDLKRCGSLKELMAKHIWH